MIMFRFHLVKDHGFTLNWQLGQAHIATPDVMTRKLTLSPVEIQSTDNNQCVKLKNLMEAGEGNTEARGLPNASGNASMLNWTLKVEIGIRVDHPMSRDYIRVWGTKEGNLLTRLETVLNSYGLETKVNVGIKDFGVYSSSGLNVVTEEVGISELSSDSVRAPGAQLHYSGAWDKAPWDHTNLHERSRFNGIITISFIAGRKTGGDLFDTFYVSEAAGESEEQPYINRKMLKEGLDSDAMIIASDGEEIKCHRVILKGQSDVFEAMFNPASKTMESTTGVILMKDMCSKVVRAFLAFLYLDDLEYAKADSAVALDLLKAAHKYNVPRLEQRMTRIFLGKPNNWFKVEVAMQLFIFARKIPGGETLKRRAAAALKADNSNLWVSPSYRKLFQEDPDAAMELCQYLVSGGPVAGPSAAGGSEANDNESSPSPNQ